MPSSLSPFLRLRPLLHAAAGLAVVLALALPAGGALAQQGDSPQGRITGQIQGAGEGADFAGTKVVLMEFKLNKGGTPKSEPVKMQDVAADGSYVFDAVPVDKDAVYQLGTQFNGRTIGSEPFTFPDGELEVKLDLRIPKVTTDSTGVRIDEAIVAFDPMRGSVWVTEVFHVNNPTGNVIDGTRSPIEVTVPTGAKKLETLRLDLDGADHKRIGPKLLLYGNLQPGRSTMAFRYLLGAPLGTVSLDKRYPFPTRAVTVLAPAGNLSMRGDRFNPHEPQDIQGTRYDAWVANDLPATQPLDITMSGIPARQEYFLIPVVGFFAVMAGAVFWFMRRLRRGDSGDESDA